MKKYRVVGALSFSVLMLTNFVNAQGLLAPVQNLTNTVTQTVTQTLPVSTGGTGGGLIDQVANTVSNTVNTVQNTVSGILPNEVVNTATSVVGLNTSCPRKDKVTARMQRLNSMSSKQDSDKQKIIASLRKLETTLSAQDKQRVEQKISEINARMGEIKNLESNVSSELKLAEVSICGVDQIKINLNLGSIKTSQKQLDQKNMEFKNYLNGDLKNFVLSL